MKKLDISTNTSDAQVHKLIYRTALCVLAALLILQYIHNRSLWLDEAMLSLNIVQKDYAGLLKPLDYTQIAPILFLLIERAFVKLLGNAEFALRIFPLLCSIATLPLFYHFSLALTRNRIIALIAMCLLGCTPKFIYYSSETKQYAVDIFVMSLLYFTSFAQNAFPEKYRTFLLSATGVIAVFLSNVSVISLFTLGLLFAFLALREKKVKTNVWIPLLTWTISIGINYRLFIWHHPYGPIMQEYWKDSFLPIGSSGLQVIKWLIQKSGDLFLNLLPLPFLTASVNLTIILYVCGVLYLLLTKKIKLFYLCVAPVALHLLLSALKIYPFDLRLILYQAPLFLLIIATALEKVASIFIKTPFIYCSFLFLSVANFSIRSLRDLPMNNEEIRPMIDDINKSIQPGQTLYVYYGSKPAYYYYRDIGYARFGNAPVINGESHMDDKDGYANELKNVKGPVWLLFSHVYPFDGSRGEERYIVNGLGKRGNILKQFESFGSSVYLFDLR